MPKLAQRRFSPPLLRALPIAALAHRLCPALWAELCLKLKLDGADGLLAVLEAKGILQSNGDDLVMTSVPQMYKSMVDSFALREPLLFQQAHQICASFFQRRGAVGDLFSAASHYLEIGDRESAEALVARWGFSAIEGRSVPSLLETLDRMTAGDAPMPGFLYYLKARALERTGALSAALDAYDQALSAFSVDKHVSGRPPRWLPRAFVIAASAGLLSVRIGQMQRAARLLDEGRRLAGKRASAVVYHLAARLFLAHGDLGAAVRHFRLAAKAAAQTKEAAEEAEAWSGLGVVSMRAGDPRSAAAHYRQALACGGRGELRIARIQANLAMALVSIGQYAEAIRLFEEAAAVRESLGDLAGAANSVAACASAREGVGEPAGAWADLARARHLATLVGDPALELEIHLLRGALALRRGEPAVGRACIRAARSIRRSLEEPDPLLDAMLAEAGAELLLSSKQYAGAARLGRNALGIVRRHGATYLASRIRLFFARNAFAAARRASALRHLEVVAHHMVPSGLRFPHSWASRGLFELGLSRGDALVQTFCRESLAPHAASLPRPLSPNSDSFRILDRTGVFLAKEADVERLRKTPPDLLLDLPRQRLVTPLGAASLAGRRILVPMLMAFFEHRGRPLDAEELHREVWGIDRFDEAGRIRVKVALSRLRGLLGPSILETHRTTEPTGAPRTLFVIAPGIGYAVIDRS